ncbi:hypothetical protein Taro_025211 [Colocasia esculenta]|uniref:Uncharacterized protein n=1 Tax=Colocasia esculenta TaxID=4460 RepID=A0A843VFX2_COLES|nr:hypothetical protein [Colocasia esculenta]
MAGVGVLLRGVHGAARQASEVLLDRRPKFNSSFKAKSDFVGEPISVAQGGRASGPSSWRPGGSRISETAITFPHRKGNLFNMQ